MATKKAAQGVQNGARGRAQGTEAAGAETNINGSLTSEPPSAGDVIQEFLPSLFLARTPGGRLMWLDGGIAETQTYANEAMAVAHRPVRERERQQALAEAIASQLRAAWPLVAWTMTHAGTTTVSAMQGDIGVSVSATRSGQYRATASTGNYGDDGWDLTPDGAVRVVLKGLRRQMICAAGSGNLEKLISNIEAYNATVRVFGDEFLVSTAVLSRLARAQANITAALGDL